MKSIIFCISFLGILSFNIAQDTVLYKFNNLKAKNWQETEMYEVVHYTSSDSLQATSRKYKKDGRKISETHFIDFRKKLKTGEQQKWYNDGVLAVRKNFASGKLNGELQRFSKKGVLYYEANYDQGTMLSDTTYEGVLSEEEKNSTVVQSMPIALGCERYESAQMRSECTTELIIYHIANVTKYPNKARKKGVVGTVYVNYIVDEEGKVTEARVIKGIENGELLEEEALRVINTMPDMIPGVQFGDYVKVQYNVPIKFKLVD